MKWRGRDIKPRLQFENSAVLVIEQGKIAPLFTDFPFNLIVVDKDGGTVTILSNVGFDAVDDVTLDLIRRDAEDMLMEVK